MMEAGEVAGLTTLVGAISAAIGAVAAALINFLRNRSSIRISEAKEQARLSAEEHKTTVGEQWQIITDLRQQIERDNLVKTQMQEAIQLLQEESSACREDYGRLQTATEFIYDLLVRHHAALEHMGWNPGPLPKMPEVRESPRKPRTEFAVAQATQSAVLTKEASEVLDQQVSLAASKNYAAHHRDLSGGTPPSPGQCNSTEKAALPNDDEDTPSP